MNGNVPRSFRKNIGPGQGFPCVAKELWVFWSDFSHAGVSNVTPLAERYRGDDDATGLWNDVMQ